MDTTETSGCRELTACELEQVTGALLACANGAHFKTATITVRTSSSGSFWGTDEAGGQQA
jgi:hypothetical protein